MPSFHRGLLPALLASALLGTGCGQIELPFWINIDAENSSGSLGLGENQIGLGFSGGFYAKMDLDTSNLLTQGVTGTIEIPVVRMVATPDAMWQPLLGNICMYADSSTPLIGDVQFDILSGESDFDLPLVMQGWSTALGPSLGAFEFAFPTGGGEGDGGDPIDFQMDLGALIDALFFDGDIKDAIQIPISLQSEIEVPVLGLVDFDVTLDLASDNIPSDVDAGSVDDCLSIIHAQAGAIPYHVQPRATFLRTSSLDGDKRPPVVLDLAQVGAVAGDTLRFTRTGHFEIGLGVNEYGGNAVFSASDVVLGPTGTRYRVPDALDAGNDFFTPWVSIFPTDIPEDFGVFDPGADVVVPDGATHLILGVQDTFYADNSGVLFTVWVEKIPDVPGLVNGDMEDTSDVLDDGVGWEIDDFSIVGAESGITPHGGASMLRFEATDGTAATSVGSNVLQVVDVSDHAGSIDLATSTFGVSGFFNRVAGDAQTDTFFVLVLRARDAADVELGNAISPYVSDGDTATWEEHSTSLALPVGTRSVQVEIVAFENVFNDAAYPEFDGHYADDVSVSFTP